MQFYLKSIMYIIILLNCSTLRETKYFVTRYNWIWLTVGRKSKYSNVLFSEIVVVFSIVLQVRLVVGFVWFVLEFQAHVSDGTVKQLLDRFSENSQNK